MVMKNVYSRCFLLIALLISSYGIATAHPHSEDDTAPKKRSLKLQSYEPNTIGITHDDNDVSFMDFKISLKYPMFHKGEPNEKWQKAEWLNSWFPMPYFAFTGRFGQYINTRRSSPVISKVFNPKIFGRYWLDGGSYIDAAYAHESNGQNINEQSTYINLQNEFVSLGENPEFANDYISRGWDYWELRWKSGTNLSNHFTYYVNLKHYLNDGFLQGSSEEVNVWEAGFNEIQRRHVDGVTLVAKYSKDYLNEDGSRGFYSGHKIALLFTTGYRDAFEHNTTRVEYTWKFFDVPLMFWWSNGYNSDLIDYNQRVTSYGFALELRTFLSDI